ncbi:retropepsin-like aspartic protease family protein [Sediminicola arcticus]|uniref:Retropepsin-like aspartic protease n=1 Tax=Sediminicola arcticus TaxID=1574308 RepID=A0ABV2SS83_9FLAO
MKNIKILLFVVVIIFGCNRPNRGATRNTDSRQEVSSKSKKVYGQRSAGQNIVKMNYAHGVYEVPIEINGTPMNFIFDTGASSISISATEAMFLYKQGKITDEDIVGSLYFQDATGSISEGTEVILKSVKIGNREIKNVKASIVHNLNAPLLLGQSALAQFGKVTIDYNSKYISFE